MPREMIARRPAGVSAAYTRDDADVERMAGEHHHHAPTRGMIDDALQALDADHDAGRHDAAGVNERGCCNRCGRWVA